MGYINDIIDAIKRKPKAADIINKIEVTQLFRTSENIQRWRNALNRAESETAPDRTELQRIFKDVMLDAHLTSLHNTIVKTIKSTPLHVVDVKTGEIDQEASDLFKRKWMRDLIGMILDAPLYGYSLIQLGDIEDRGFTSVTKVRNEYVIPERRAVKKHLRVTTKDLLSIDDPKFSQWLIFVHEPGDMGLLNKAAPLVLWKKAVTGAWAQAAEIFGMPMRVGKTDINNPKRHENMVAMLRDMERAAYAVIDEEDSIEFIQSSRQADVYHIYNNMIDRMNSELSKLLVGQTMTSDDGSSLSQAQVHQAVLAEYTADGMTLVIDVLNDQLLPLLVRHGILPMGKRFEHDNEEKIDLGERFRMVMEISKNLSGAKVPLEYIEETFGIPLEEVEALDLGGNPPGTPPGDDPDEPDPDDPEEGEEEPEGPQSVIPGIAELYASAHKCDH